MTLNVEHRSLTRHILARYRAASPQHVAEGLAWYDAAFTAAERLAWHPGASVAQAAVAIAHLSPRTTWKNNLLLAEELLLGRQRPIWALRRQWELAGASLRAEDPLSTFSTAARKTRNFAHAILGDRHAVVVDIWAARVAGASERSVRTSLGYQAVAEAYRRGSRIAGVSARDLQAITWIAIRGEAA